MKFILKIHEGIFTEIEAETIGEAIKKRKELISVLQDPSLKEELLVEPIKRRTTPKTLHDYILLLLEEKFFEHPKGLGEITEKLKEMAVYYPVTSFPQYLNKLLKERILRRFKENRKGKEIWVYVKN